MEWKSNVHIWGFDIVSEAYFGILSQIVVFKEWYSSSRLDGY